MQEFVIISIILTQKPSYTSLCLILKCSKTGDALKKKKIKIGQVESVFCFEMAFNTRPRPSTTLYSRLRFHSPRGMQWRAIV